MAVAAGWEALRGDPLPWLLDERRPNLHWRVLLELVGRPADSPAVARARGGASAAVPVASLLADLLPDGSWSSPQPLWAPAGPGFRLVTAVQWGADPTDPRLQAGAERLLEWAPGEGGFAPGPDESPAPWLTARTLQALAELGFSRHERCQEALAWLEEAAPTAEEGGWLRGADDDAKPCGVTPVAALAALTAGGDGRRTKLRDRAIAEIARQLASERELGLQLGHPNLERSDCGEALWALARAGAGLDPAAAAALRRLQQLQLDGGRWRRDLAVGEGLGACSASPAGEPSRWITLRCVVAVLHYAVAAELPRLFPEKPAAPPQ